MSLSCDTTPREWGAESIRAEGRCLRYSGPCGESDSPRGAEWSPRRDLGTESNSGSKTGYTVCDCEFLLQFIDVGGDPAELSFDVNELRTSDIRAAYNKAVESGNASALAWLERISKKVNPEDPGAIRPPGLMTAAIVIGYLPVIKILRSGGAAWNGNECATAKGSQLRAWLAKLAPAARPCTAGGRAETCALHADC